MARQTLTILQINDTHAYLDLHPEVFWSGTGFVYRPAGGFARIATLVRDVRRERGERVLFCDNGDTLHGTYPAVATQGAALVPILNALGPDAMTAHWDFGYGPQVLQQRVAELHYPLLAANVFHSDNGEHAFDPYMVREIGGVRVGVIGLASNMVDKTMPPHFGEGLRFTLGRDELPAIIELLRSKERVDLIVLLSHLGFPQDVQLVADVAGIDVCLSGHTHNRLFKPAVVGDTLVIQSGSHGAFVGRLDLELEHGRVVDYRHRLINVSEDIVPDGELESLVHAALALFAAELSEVVGETRTALNRATTLEATTDNLLLQALLDVTGAEIALSNGWRYGAPILPGPITLNDLYNIVPMNPPVETVELQGAELIELLEENLERTFARDPYQQLGGYLKRALGLTAYIKIENPRGQRLQQLFVGNREVDPSHVYQVAFVTEQGVPSKFGAHRQQHGERAVEAMRSYLQRNRPVSADLRGTFVPV